MLMRWGKVTAFFRGKGKGWTVEVWSPQVQKAWFVKSQVTVCYEHGVHRYTVLPISEMLMEVMPTHTLLLGGIFPSSQLLRRLVIGITGFFVWIQGTCDENNSFGSLVAVMSTALFLNSVFFSTPSVLLPIKEKAFYSHNLLQFMVVR